MVIFSNDRLWRTDLSSNQCNLTTCTSLMFCHIIEIPDKQVIIRFVDRNILIYVYEYIWVAVAGDNNLSHAYLLRASYMQNCILQRLISFLYLWLNSMWLFDLVQKLPYALTFHFFSFQFACFPYRKTGLFPLHSLNSLRKMQIS